MARAELQRQNQANEQTNGLMVPSISSLLRMTFEKWYGDNIPRHAAALAFYTLFAIAPLLLLSVELMAVLYGRETAEAQLTAQVEQYVHSADAATLAQTVLDNALPSSANWIVTVGIIIALIYGASAVFFELQVMLNIIWGVHLEDGGDFWQVIWDRILAIVMVMFSGILIVTGLVLTLWYSEASVWAMGQPAGNGNAEQLSYFLLLFAITALVFALIYKFVPAVHIAWHDVMIGAVSTAFLVSIARLVITLYLSYNRMGSVYGAAGSLVILLLWVYYSAQIFFLGAEFTHVYSRTYGARRRGQAVGTWKADPPERRSNPLRRLNGRAPTSDVAEESTEQPAEAPMQIVVKAGERSAPDVEIEIINLNDRYEPVDGNQAATAAEDSTPDAEIPPWRSWLRLPQFRGFATTRSTNQSRADSQSLHEAEGAEVTIEAPTPNLPTIPIKEERSGTRQRLQQIVTIPLSVLRPFREIITAVSVIGALSIAVLFGFPWRRRRRKGTDQSPTQPPQAEEPPTAPETNDRPTD